MFNRFNSHHVPSVPSARGASPNALNVPNFRSRRDGTEAGLSIVDLEAGIHGDFINGLVGKCTGKKPMYHGKIPWFPGFCRRRGKTSKYVKFHV